MTATETTADPAPADEDLTVLSGVDLQYSYGATRALRGADIAVRRGETVAVLGPSGSGKSTLLHCLAGILEPEAGTVQFCGTDLSTLSDRARSEIRREHFGFVFQFGQLLPELSCLENVALPRRLAGFERRTAEQDALFWLDRLGIAEVADQLPGHVSGGQAQRAAVARALVGRPAVIFADEPTGALDTMQGEVVMQLLTDAVRFTDAAMVLVTHEHRVAAYSDREIVVRDGRSSETRSR